MINRLCTGESSVAFIIISLIYSCNRDEWTISFSSDLTKQFKHSKKIFPSFWIDSILETIEKENVEITWSSETIFEKEQTNS